MLIDIPENAFYEIRDHMVVQAMKETIEILESEIKNESKLWQHPDDVKEFPKLLKAAKRMLDYFSIPE